MPHFYRAGENPEDWKLTGEKKVKYIGLLSDKFTNVDEWSRNLIETGEALWCVCKTAGKIHTPQKGDIIAVRTGYGSNAKIIYYVEVISNPIVNLTNMTEGFDRDSRTSRGKNHLNMKVSMFKKLENPLKRDFISKDLPHPIEPGIMKRNTTFKPIDHIYRWIINKNTNNSTINKID